MKLLITSVDAIIDNETGTYFEGIKDVLNYFESIDYDNRVVIISINQERLDSVPNDFHKLHVSGLQRKGVRFIQKINQNLEIEYKDIMVLGGKVDDMILAANSKLIFLNADYSKTNNPADKIFEMNYGVIIAKATRLKFFFDHFLKIKEPWYYRLEIDKQTTLYGLTNAMTKIETNPDVKLICEQLKYFLKVGVSDYKNPFLIYALMSVNQIFNEASEINYWGYYPSSNGSENLELKTFKEVLRRNFKSSTSTEDILLRIKPSIPRKSLNEDTRIKNGCDSEFDTIILNPYFEEKIKGKNVCIIDDFTNHGSSCETVRHLLQLAGVNKIIFISLGKFRTDYKVFEYKLKGNIFAVGYSYKRIGKYTPLTGTVNKKYSQGLIDSLNDIIR